jgi:hypothetical protein
MAEKTLEQRVSALEAQLSNKTLEQHFREQAELIDRRFGESFREHAELIDKLFVYRFEEFENRWDAKLDGRLKDVQERVEFRLERADSRLESVQRDVAVIKHAVKALLTRLS